MNIKHSLRAWFRFYASFIHPSQSRIASLRGARLMTEPHQYEAVMFDVLIIVLGTGGILLMALYAALCERI